MGRRGFTLVDLMLAIVVLALLALMGVPKVGRMIQRARVNRAVGIVAGDLEQAVTIAARQRKPVRLACTCGSGQYTVIDRSGGASRLSRDLAGDPAFKITSMSFSPTPVDIFPSGVTSADLIVTIGVTGYTRQIRLTTAGYVRVLPP